MRRKLFLAVMAAAILFTACGKKPAEDKAAKEKQETTQTEEAKDDASAESKDTEDKETDEKQDENTSEEGFDTDAEVKTIQKKLADLQSSASSIQDELKKVADFAKDYEAYNEKDLPQAEMNLLSFLPEELWKTEASSLWDRYKKNASDSEKKNYERWNSNKDSVLETQLAAYKEGTIYGMLYNSTDALFYKHQATYLASLLAGSRNEKFDLPDRDLYGSYTDNDGKSMLLIQPSMESGYDGIFRLDKNTSFEGSVEKAGEDYIFTSNDGKLTGTLSLQWFGAAFTVSESKTNALHDGEVYEFSIVY